MPPSTRGTLRTRVRTLIGDASSEAFSDVDLNILCNDAWQRFANTRSHQQQAAGTVFAATGDHFTDAAYALAGGINRIDLVSVMVTDPGGGAPTESNLNLVEYEQVHWLQETEGIQAQPRMVGVRVHDATEAGAVTYRFALYPIPDDNNGNGGYDIQPYVRVTQADLSADASVLYGCNYHETDYVARMAAADAMVALRRSSRQIAAILGPVPDGIKRNWVLERDLLVPDQPTLAATRDPNPPESRENGLIAGLR